MTIKTSTTTGIVIYLMWVVMWVTGVVLAQGFWQTLFTLCTGGFYSLYIVIELILTNVGVIL